MTAPTCTTGPRVTDGAPPANPSAETTLLNVFAAAHHLPPKSRTILAFLNDHRDPASPTHTGALSSARIHAATQITIEHICRNGLHRLLASRLMSVLTHSLSGTIYRLHYDCATRRTVLTRLQGVAAPPVQTDAARLQPSPGSITAMREELTAIEDRLAVLRQLTLNRQECLSTLQDGELQWLAHESKEAVDNREGIRFIRDRFPHYEAERMRVLDEWIARQAYGQRIPTLPSSDLQELTT